MAKEKEFQKKTGPKIWDVLFILLLLYILSSVIAFFFSFSGTDYSVGNVVLIKINAPITAEETLFLNEKTIGSEDIIQLIEHADKNPAVKAIIFEINSQGGTAVASSEIMEKVKKINKTTVSYIREIGVSGSYWIASATDYIFANSMSIVGSIGVLSSYLEVSGLLERYNITYQRLVGGEYKDMGSPLKELSSSERQILQKNIDDMHEMFLESIIQNRGLEYRSVEELKKALIYNGEEAILIGLVDEIGGKDEAINYVEEKLGITAKITVYEKKRSVFERLRGLFSEAGFSLGSGMSSGALIQKPDARVYS